MNKFVAILCLIFLFSSCEETKKVFIASQLVDCVGENSQKCMKYKENPNDEWTFFYDTIEGFEYEEGYNYEIEVSVTKIKNTPADGSSLRYKLVKVISKEKDESITKKMTESQDFKETVLEYQALSRGSFFQVTINKDSIKKTKDRSLKSFDTNECSKKDWTAIENLLEKVKITEISELKAPTGKRLFDGAPHAQLKITHKGQTYSSCSFDGGSPPEEIKPLVDYILSITEKK